LHKNIELLKIDSGILEYMKTLTLLCVEDCEDSQKAYQSIFENLVKKTIFAIDGDDGFNKYTSNDIDIIVTDYRMPKLSGLAMIEKIRENDKNIPIVLITAINDKEIIIKALKLHVNNFIQKPIKHTDIIESLAESTKLLIANKFIKENKNNIVKELQEKNDYNSYQESLAFAKELNILRNDFYYQMRDHDGISLIDFLYMPLDVMSGDAYSARRINEHSTFYLMVDGMGKGLSASLTTMLMTSFINHIIDKMLFLDSFDLGILIHETMEYIKPILLEEEALAIDYIVINNEEDMLYYAKFAMPVLLMESKDKEIIRLKSNNPPLSKWQETFNVDAYDISEIKKFLIYSDGIVENETIFENKLYSDFIENDFLNSFTREDLKDSFLEKVGEKEDDITLIYIHRLRSISKVISIKEFDSTLSDIDIANEWYTDLWQDLTKDTKAAYYANLAFTELFMNAYEHGNLGIDSSIKHILIEEDNYMSTLLEKEKECSKKISVKVTKIEHGSLYYIITQITDEGDGFDIQSLSTIFRNSKTFNGRGVFVSRKSSLGIYYNKEGNSVLYLNKISKS